MLNTSYYAELRRLEWPCCRRKHPCNNRLCNGSYSRALEIARKRESVRDHVAVSSLAEVC